MDIYDEIVRLRRLGQKCAVATIVQVNGSIPSYESAKLLVREDGSMLGTVGGGCVEAEVWTAAREVIETDKPRHLNFSLGEDAAYDNGLICGGQLNIFVEPVMPQPRAFIFGGGHVSKSLSKVANQAGFATVIVDDREAFANKERFPEADEVYAEEYENVFPKLAITSTSYVIIVTRGHRDDMRVLRWAVETPAKYVAMIGSKRKTISVVKELEKEGLPRHLFEKIFAPMGLEIGAETPEEIAISVVAEMIAMRRAPNVEWRSLSKSVFARESSGAIEVIAAVILAAGASSRMGRPKALLEYRGETFIERLVRVLSPVCDPVIVALGYHAAAIRPSVEAIATIVINPAPERGQLSSLQTALAAVPVDAEGFLFTPVDSPAVEFDTLERLAAEFRRRDPGTLLVIPRFQGKHGHPVFAARAIADEIIALPPIAQARDVIHGHIPETAYVDVNDPGILTDVDDPEAYRRLSEAAP